MIVTACVPFSFQTSKRKVSHSASNRAWERRAMTKTFHLVDPNQPGPSKETVTPAKTDWSICLLRQEATPELLQCPAQSKRHDVVLGQGYSSLAKNIRRFSELQEMPMPIDLRRLDAGSGMEATMLEHQAKWHPSCNRKFNTTKLQRAEKRHATNVAGSPARKKFTRQSTQHQTASKEVCFFCESQIHFMKRRHLI